MEQHHNNLAAVYMQKIKQLKDILNKQAVTKNELFRQLMDLSREGQQQREYLAKLKMIYNDTFSLKNSISQKQISLITSEYMGDRKKIKQVPKRRNLKSGLLSSGKLSWSIQKCKSTSNSETKLFRRKVDYVPNNSKCMDKNSYLLIG